MTNTHDDLVLDADGIPILTERVQDEARPDRVNDVSADELTVLLLKSTVFRQQLDEIATQLARTVREEIEQAIRPVLEEAISLALDDSSKASREAVRARLESALPGLIARTLQD